MQNCLHGEYALFNQPELKTQSVDLYCHTAIRGASQSDFFYLVAPMAFQSTET